MNNKEQIPKPEEALEELDMDALASVDDFIKELEAKEKDLHITADMTIEIEQSEYDPRVTPDFVPQNIVAPLNDNAVSSPANLQGSSPGSKTRIYELENEVRSLQERLTTIRMERNDVQEKSDRRLKDFEGFKYRVDRERRGAFIDQISNLAKQMLPVLDNLDRALNSVANLEKEKGSDVQQFYDGIGLVNQQLGEVFSSMGVEPIKTIGETFDPNFHEAVATEDDTDLPSNTVTGEMLRGYRIGNRVIRHSMVKVTTGPPPAAKTVADEDQNDDDSLQFIDEASSASIPDPADLLPDPADISDLEAMFPESE